MLRYSRQYQRRLQKRTFLMHDWVQSKQVCDAMEDQMCEGGNVVDHHSCEFFPERWAPASTFVSEPY